MAQAYQTPGWIQPADPAAHYQVGYQIGVHVGAQQAAQAFQQQQMAMQERKQAMAEQQQVYEDQMNMQVLNLKAAETARKFQANQAFRSRVASGEDPSRVLMELGPDMGESPTSILHDQAMRDQARATMAFRQANAQRLGTQFQQGLEERKREANARITSPEVQPKIWEKDGHTFITNPKTGHTQEIDKKVSEQKFITDNLTKWMTGFGITDENEAVDRLRSVYQQNFAKPDNSKDNWLEEFQSDWEQATSPGENKDPLNIRSLLK